MSCPEEGLDFIERKPQKRLSDGFFCSVNTKKIQEDVIGGISEEKPQEENTFEKRIDDLDFSQVLTIFGGVSKEPNKFKTLYIKLFERITNNLLSMDLSSKDLEFIYSGLSDSDKYSFVTKIIDSLITSLSKNEGDDGFIYESQIEEFVYFLFSNMSEFGTKQKDLFMAYMNIKTFSDPFCRRLESLQTKMLNEARRMDN